MLWKNKQREEISLDEAIAKYSDKYYMSVEYKPDGTIALWIGSPKEKKNEQEPV